MDEEEKNNVEVEESEETHVIEDDTSLIEEIANLNSKIEELTRKNNTLVSEYKRLKNSQSRVSQKDDKPNPREYDVTDIIKQTYRGVYE